MTGSAQSGPICAFAEIGVIQMAAAIALPDFAPLHPGYLCHAETPEARMERSAIRGRKRSNRDSRIALRFIRATRHPDIRASARMQLREIRDRVPEWFAIDAISSLAGRFSSPSR